MVFQNQEAATKLKTESGGEDFKDLLSKFCQWLEKTEAALTLMEENLTPVDTLLVRMIFPPHTALSMN